VLGPTDFQQLRHFMEHPSRAVSCDQLINSVFSHDTFLDARTVDFHIHRLRKARDGRRHQDMSRNRSPVRYALNALATIV